MGSTAFGIRYAWWARPLFSVLGMGPRSSGVGLTTDALRVRMGVAFRADIPLASVAGVGPETGRVLGWGVHGWAGRWLVNGSARGLVRIELRPPCHARVLGFPVRPATLRISLVDPVAFVAAVHRARTGA